MRSPEQKLATKLRKAHEREVHHAKAWKKHPASVRYAKAKFKKGKKRQKQHKHVVVHLGVQ
jgi:hypothetical protein